jgi:hypothetical protein
MKQLEGKEGFSRLESVVDGMSAEASAATSFSQQRRRHSHDSSAPHIDWHHLISVMADAQTSSPSDASIGNDAVRFHPAAQPPPSLPGNSRAAVTFMRHVVRLQCQGHRLSLSHILFSLSHIPCASLKVTGCLSAHHHHHRRRRRRPPHRPPTFIVSPLPPCACVLNSKVTKWVTLCNATSFSFIL